MSLRLVFMGTPDFAVPTLVEIVGRGHEVAAVYTRAPKPAGRAAWSCSRRRSSARRGASALPVLHARDAAHRGGAGGVPRARRRCRGGGGLWADPAEADPRCAFRSAASTCMPRCCRAGAARRRSTAPIMAGDAETGVMVMQMEEGLDTGPVAMAERVPIGADMTAGDLHDALARLGADLMVRALGALERGTLQLTPQPDAGVTYAGQDRQGRDAHRLGAALAGACTTISAACRRFRAPGSSMRRAAGRVKVLRTHARRGAARPARCSTTR